MKDKSKRKIGGGGDTVGKVILRPVLALHCLIREVKIQYGHLNPHFTRCHVMLCYVNLPCISRTPFRGTDHSCRAARSAHGHNLPAAADGLRAPQLHSPLLQRQQNRRCARSIPRDSTVAVKWVTVTHTFPSPGNRHLPL